jgi:hypothetical protein
MKEKAYSINFYQTNLLILALFLYLVICQFNLKEKNSAVRKRQPPKPTYVYSHFSSPRDANDSYCAKLTRFEELPKCDMTSANMILKKAYECLKPSSQEMVYFHQYLMDTTGNLNQTLNTKGVEASIKSFLITQNLKGTKLIIWTDTQLKPILEALPTVKQFKNYIQVRLFVYEEQIKGSPLEHSDFYSNQANILKYMVIDNFSSIVRYIILWRFGGVYFDNDGKLLLLLLLSQ